MLKGKNVSIGKENVTITDENIKKKRKGNLVLVHAVVVIFFMFIQNKIAGGMTDGAVK